VVIIWQSGATWTRTVVDHSMPTRVSSGIHSAAMFMRTQPLHVRILLCIAILLAPWPLMVMLHGIVCFIASCVQACVHSIASFSWPSWMNIGLRVLGLVMDLYAGSIIVLMFSSKSVWDPIPVRPTGSDLASCIAECIVSVIVAVVKPIILGFILCVHVALFVIGLILLLGPTALIIFVAILAFVVVASMIIAAILRNCPAMRATTHVDHPNLWPGARLLTNDSPENKRVVEAFHQSCFATASMYPFKLSIVEVYEIQNPNRLQLFEQQKEDMRRKGEGSADTLANTRLLYHGTSPEAARNIITGGFRLPTFPGMFGKGVYFAPSPLKSWQYACRSNGYVLACDVALGKCKQVRSAAPSFNPSRDLKQGWLSSLFSKRDYDSVEALPQGQGGAVRVTEYAIYVPERALPRYLLKLAET